MGIGFWSTILVCIFSEVKNAMVIKMFLNETVHSLALLSTGLNGFMFLVYGQGR